MHTTVHLDELLGSAWSWDEDDDAAEPRSHEPSTAHGSADESARAH